MPAFFFHLYEHGEVASDTARFDLSGTDEARELAVATVRDILSAQVREGVLRLNAFIAVDDSGGHEVLRVTSKEALTIEAL